MENNLINKKIAIIYDWFDKWGGVERIILILKELFPQAIFFTSYYDKKNASWAKDLNIKTSFIEKLPSFIKKNRILSLPFYPFAFESFDFSDFDLVISISSAFSKAVITKPKTFHLSYLLTPTRFLWVMPENYGFNKIKKWFFSPFLNYLKKWDFVASKRPDKIISISKTVANRCLKYYQRESEVIYPPFDFQYWNKIKEHVSKRNYFKKEIQQIIKKNFFLVVSRLEPYKKVNLVINSFLKLKKKNQLFSDYSLVIVGDGSQKKNLEKLGRNKIIFLSKISDIDLGYLYYYAKAHIIPQEEDFGYTALESQFFNCPVIAYNKGGVTETVVNNETGIFFKEQKEKEIVLTLERFNVISYNLKEKLFRLENKHLTKFDKKVFIKNFLKVIKDRI